MQVIKICDRSVQAAWQAESVKNIWKIIKQMQGVWFRKMDNRMLTEAEALAAITEEFMFLSLGL